jgi:hypothetical protein
LLLLPFSIPGRLSGTLGGPWHTLPVSSNWLQLVTGRGVLPGTMPPPLFGSCKLPGTNFQSQRTVLRL